MAMTRKKKPKPLTSPPLASPNTPDRLTEDEAKAAAPPPAFWDVVNARPAVQTPAACGMYAASTLTVRDQGARSTCVAFTLVAAVELRAWRNGIAIDLSEQHAAYLLMRAQGRGCHDDESIRLIDAANGLFGQRICPEHAWTYTDDRGPPPPSVDGTTGFSIEEHFVIPRLKLPKVSRPLQPCLDGPGISNTGYLEAIISQGYEIATAICLAGTNGPASKELEPVMIACSGSDPSYCLPTDPKFWHAVLITGYVRLAEIPYFVCRDSLSGLSFNKPLLISYDYMRTYAEYGLVVTKIRAHG